MPAERPHALRRQAPFERPLGMVINPNRVINRASDTLTANVQETNRAQVLEALQINHPVQSSLLELARLLREGQLEQFLSTLLCNDLRFSGTPTPSKGPIDYTRLTRSDTSAPLEHHETISRNLGMHKDGLRNRLAMFNSVKEVPRFTQNPFIPSFVGKGRNKTIMYPPSLIRPLAYLLAATGVWNENIYNTLQPKYPMYQEELQRIHEMPSTESFADSLRRVHKVKRASDSSVRFALQRLFGIKWRSVVWMRSPSKGGIKQPFLPLPVQALILKEHKEHPEVIKPLSYRDKGKAIKPKATAKTPNKNHAYHPDLSGITTRQQALRQMTLDILSMPKGTRPTMQDFLVAWGKGWGNEIRPGDIARELYRMMGGKIFEQAGEEDDPLLPDDPFDPNDLDDDEEVYTEDD